MHTDKKIIRKVSKFVKKNIIITTLSILILATFIFIVNKIITTPPTVAEILTTSTLEEIINISELSTFESVYIGIADVPSEENPEKINYYVYYESRVQAGFNFDEIKIEADHANKKITVFLPDISITNVNVDIASLDYIFINEKANTSTVSVEAYKACISDVTNESYSETAIFDLAEQNAKNIIQALIKPFVDELDEDYSLEII